MGIDDVHTLPAKMAALPYYEKLFTDAYGTKEISFEKIANSISFFVASIKSADTRLDRYDAGKVSLNAEELHGQVLFNTKYNCATCHRVDTSGYRGTDFMDIGLARKNGDDGLGGITQEQADMNTFRIPNLRNVGLTAPYMHDGRFATLHQVLDHYSSGIDSTPNLHFMLRDIDGRPIRMNISASEKDAIVAFLNTLTDYTMVTDAKYSDPFRLK
jgi:cytochrome c peroxidase